ncbi:MAG: FMN-binding negative transcriptional regulator [Chloroflexota bacterium]
MNFSSHYPLKAFQERRFEKLKHVINHYPLATLISQTTSYPMVTQVPLIFDESASKLLGHFDRNNPHCQLIDKEKKIYCLFNGPNHYMTPTIYPDRQYPGWNYVAVHVEGLVKPMKDEAELEALLLETAVLNEPLNSGYRLTPNQKNFHVYIKMILGFEIEIVDIKGVFKLAQDKGQPHIELAKNHLVEQSQKDISKILDELL